MKWISGLKPRFENQVQTWKWKTQKWEAEFQVYFNKSINLSGFIYSRFVKKTCEHVKGAEFLLPFFSRFRSLALKSSTFESENIIIWVKISSFFTHTYDDLFIQSLFLNEKKVSFDIFFMTTWERENERKKEPQIPRLDHVTQQPKGTCQRTCRGPKRSKSWKICFVFCFEEVYFSSRHSYINPSVTFYNRTNLFSKMTLSLIASARCLVFT